MREQGPSRTARKPHRSVKTGDDAPYLPIQKRQVCVNGRPYNLVVNLEVAMRHRIAHLVREC